MRTMILLWIVALLGVVCAVPASAQQAAAPAQSPAEVQQLVDLLRKPAVQEWLARGAPAAAASSAASQDTVGGEIKQEETNLAREFRRGPRLRFPGAGGRASQTQIFAQGPAGIILVKQPAALQFRNHVTDEIRV